MAASVALELLVWDKNRSLPGPAPRGREDLIDRGAQLYDQFVRFLHGEAVEDPAEPGRSWLARSLEMRRGRDDMTTRRFLGSSRPKLDKEDIARLDRRHPERSFTGEAETRTLEDDLVEQLERLRALRDDGTLTVREFAVAKARLLGPG
jgi:hypothetical protein